MLQNELAHAALAAGARLGIVKLMFAMRDTGATDQTKSQVSADGRCARRLGE